MESSEIIILKAIFVCLVCSLCIRISLSIAKQRWVETYQQTLTYILLPMTTFIITKVISNNIALSLGMVGALSIVRFRNPVKSPFELIMFFALITVGIAMAVKAQWGILLTVVIVSTILMSKLIEKVSHYFGYDIYSLSFEEGITLNLLEVQSFERLDELALSKYLLQASFLNEEKKKYYYRLGSRNRQDIINLKSKLEKNKQIINIDIRLN